MLSKLGLGLADGTAIPKSQLDDLIRSSSVALRGSNHKRYKNRSNVAEHFYSPSLHATFPPCATVYQWINQLARGFALGYVKDDEWPDLWSAQDDACNAACVLLAA